MRVLPNGKFFSLQWRLDNLWGKGHKDTVLEMERAILELDELAARPAAKRRGRPKGPKNKPKVV